MRGTPAFLKRSMIALLCRPDLTEGIPDTPLEDLNVMGVIDP